MAVRITDRWMASDMTGHWAWQDSGDPGMWALTWLPATQRCTRSQAITAMVLAEAATAITVACGTDVHDAHTHRLWPHVCGWAAELGLNGAAALMLARQPLPTAEPGADINARGQVFDHDKVRWVYVAQGREKALATADADQAAHVAGGEQ